MRPLAVGLFVACALVFGQTAGVAHALSHLRQPAKTLPAGAQHSHHCLACDAYDTLGHGVAPTPGEALVPPSPDAPFFRGNYGSLSARFLPVFARAPPPRSRELSLRRAARMEIFRPSECSPRRSPLAWSRGGAARDSRSYEFMGTKKWKQQNGFSL